MADPFITRSKPMPSTIRNGATVTPADGADLPTMAYGLWVGGAGTLTVTFLETGTNITLSAVPAGTYIPIAVKRVWATGTTATLIVALW